MTVLRVVYSRIDHLVHEVAKFGVVGGLAYVVTVLVTYAYLLIEPNDQITAYIAGNAAATVVAYLGNRYWTYRDRDSAGSVREMVLFAAVNGVTIAIQSSVVALTFYGLDLRSHVENFVSEFVLAIGIGMAFRFWCYRTFIFPENGPAAVGGEAPFGELVPVPQEF